MKRPFDPGLQPERTMLAWQRTVLALGVASALVVRLTADDFGTLGVIGGLAGIALSATAYAAATRRYDRTYRALATTGVLPSDGVATLLTSAAALLLGIAAAAYVAVGTA